MPVILEQANYGKRQNNASKTFAINKNNASKTFAISWKIYGEYIQQSIAEMIFLHMHILYETM